MQVDRLPARNSTLPKVRKDAGAIAVATDWLNISDAIAPTKHNWLDVVLSGCAAMQLCYSNAAAYAFAEYATEYLPLGL